MCTYVWVVFERVRVLVQLIVGVSLVCVRVVYWFGGLLYHIPSISLCCRCFISIWFVAFAGGVSVSV